MSAPEAYDRIVYSAELAQRIADAAAELSKTGGLEDEAGWLESAQQRIARERAGLGDLLTRALQLPDLGSLRAERGRALQDEALDAVDRLHAAIRKAAGERSPVIDVLYMNLKLPPLRKAGREAFEAFCAEFERRLGSSYLTRMFADETYLPAGPALDDLRRAFENWRGVAASPALGEEEARALEEELAAFARRLELACRQAVLLADAALLSAEHLREASGIFDKPRRRAARS